MKIFFKLISIFLISISSVVANEVLVFEFTEAELSELTVRKVRGAKNETKYTVGKNENGNFLKVFVEASRVRPTHLRDAVMIVVSRIGKSQRAP